MGEHSDGTDDIVRPDDEWLENLVANAIAEEHPVPPEAVDAAAALFDFVNFDASIAEVMESELAVRSQSTRSRTFTWADRCSLVLESVVAAGRTLLTGVVMPAICDIVTVRTPDGATTDVELVAGTFELSTSAPMLRLELDGGAFVTPWFRPA